MRTLALALVAAIAVLTACPSAPPPPPPAPPAPPAAPPGPPPPPSPPPPPAGPPVAEPAGIAAGSHKLPEAAKNGPGKTLWTVDPAATTVAFTIVSNSAGPITGKFPGGADGAYDAKAKKGAFTIDLTKLASANKDNAPNPARDVNVVEAFFAARPFAAADKKAAVDDAWKKLAGKIASGVGKAALVIDSVEGGAAEAPKDDKPVDGVVNGKLVLWESVEVPVSFPVSVTKKDAATLEVKGTAPATFNIEKAVGTDIRNALFGTLLAAGCAHQPGISSDVAVNLELVTLKKAK